VGLTEDECLTGNMTRSAIWRSPQGWHCDRQTDGQMEFNYHTQRLYAIRLYMTE